MGPIPGWLMFCRRVIAVGAVAAGCLCLAGGCALLPVESAGAGAAIVDYPDMDAADCSVTYGSYSWCKGSPARPGSARGYGYRNCTDGVAFWVNQYTGGALPGNWGNAATWDDRAAPAYTVLDGTTDQIEPGDIAQSDDGGYGHVGFVVAVTKNSAGHVVSFTAAELNKGGSGEYTAPDANVYASRNGAGKFARAGAFDWDHFIDVNGLGVGMSAEGQEVTDGLNVYTTAGGRYWFIKQRSNWTAADTAHWGNAPQPVTTEEIHAQEVGWDGAGRHVGAHAPIDGTAVYRDGGNGQQYVFYSGRYFPITVGELDDLRVRDKALPVPGGRLDDFAPAAGSISIPSGALFRYAGQPLIRQAVATAGTTYTFPVGGETTRACLTLQQGASVYGELVLPAQARNYAAAQELTQPAACAFPPGMVLNGPGGAEKWRIEGDGVSAPYRRRYYYDMLTLYVNTSATPFYRTLPSVAALNDIPEGPGMDISDSTVFVNLGNGDEFVRRQNSWHKVPWPDMNNCLGIAPAQIIAVPAAAVGALPQDTPMTCLYANRLVAYNGGDYFIDAASRLHAVLNPAVRSCIATRRAAGATIDVPTDPHSAYTLADTAYCPYETDVGLNFIHEGNDPTVWVVAVADGRLVKRHAGGFCVTDPRTTQLKRYHLFRVPPDETAGIPQSEDWFPTSNDCAGLPGEGREVHQTD